MNYYQRFLGDYARDTRHLSLIAHGAYSLLLDAYYATERALPADLDSLCRICGAINQAERDAVQTIADMFFPVAEGGLRHNKRADLEIAKARPRIAAAKANGLKRGMPAGSQQEASGLPEESQQEPGGATALHLHQHHNQSSTPSTKKRRVNPKVAAVPLPSWIPAEQWDAWLEVRKKKRAPNTSHALRLAVKELEKLRSAGHDPKAVLEQSILRGWQSVYEIKANGSQSRQSALESRNAEVTRRLIENA